MQYQAPAPATPQYQLATPSAPPYQLASTPASPYQLSQGSAAPAPSSTAPAQWDQAAFLQAMHNFTINGDGGWIVDSGAPAHMSANLNLMSSLKPTSSIPPITVGNVNHIPVTDWPIPSQNCN
jgi:hypothetical protein